MKKEIKKSLGLFFLGIIICVFSVFLSNYSAYAKNKSSSKNNNENSDAEYYYKNEKTGYEAYIFDESDPGLLTEKEKEKLLDDIKGVTTYGNVIFYSNDNSDYEGSAKKRYTKYFGEESGTIFAINMNKRKITLWSYGDVLDVISKGRSDVIVSNTYSYATKKKYAASLNPIISSLVNTNSLFCVITSYIAFKNPLINNPSRRSLEIVNVQKISLIFQIIYSYITSALCVSIS